MLPKYYLSPRRTHSNIQAYLHPALLHIRTSSVAAMLAITKHGVCVCQKQLCLISQNALHGKYLL